MPEYLSPGVYVEEVNTGSKPIEGVSTSTAGMVGVTERGPENIPVLMTSYGEYRRVFGGELRLADYTDGSGRVHAYLPHAVQGFFQNDGRRDYVVRVLPDDAQLAERNLFDRGDVASADTMLLRAAPQGSGTTTNLPLLYALDVSALADNEWIRVGDGSRAEYLQIAVSGIGTAQRHVALNFPLALSHNAAVNVDEIVHTPDAAYTGGFTVVGDVNAGSTTITVHSAVNADVTRLLTLPSAVNLLEVGDSAAVAEYVVATAAVDLGGGDVRVTLSSALAINYAEGTAVNAMDVTVLATATAVLNINASAGDSLIYLDNLGGNFVDDTHLVIVDGASANVEVRRIGTLSELQLDLPCYTGYPTGTRLVQVIMADHETDVAAAIAPDVNSATAFTVDSTDGFAIGMQIDVGGDAGVIDDIDEDRSRITLQAALAGGTPAVGTTITPAAKNLTADIAAGRVVLSLDNRLGLAADDVLRIGSGVDVEYVTIASISGEREVAPDSGTVVLTAPLQQAFTAGTEVVRQLPPVIDTTIPAMTSVLPAAEDSDTLYVNDAVSYAVGDIVLTTLPSGTTYFHELRGVDTTLTPREITLNAANPLDFSHESGAPLVEREAQIEVYALDRGAWGNRLLVAVDDVESSLVQAELTAANGVNPVISLSNYTNLEAGTVLEFFHPDTGDQLGTPAKVISVDRSAGEVELAAILHADIITAFGALTNRVEVRSREFVINVFLLQRPDPAVPSRNRTVIDSESFLVTMDPRHSRYIHKVIGTTWTAGNEQDDDGVALRLWDQRSEGESRYIRVRDVAAGNTAVLESIRLGPEVLFDVLDNGQLQAARMPLSQGRDGLDSIINVAQGDNIYLGVDSDEPRLRTGIHALRNITDISIVAVPGQTSVGVQQALINHCENDHYRFAVLDAHAPNRDTLVDVQNQRQAFDSKYAALYHPWLTISEPLPANISSIRQMPIPPSGHMMGIYARTDNTRGVHKAPANEVVRGITGLTRNLNKREHDILNPYPKNINVIRDFRDANRGLRVWGARCITSDSDYKYVNVRRLMIFLEASIDRGLQWVVFEPNADPLWARVRRSITNFLNVVWRNGALEGTKPEQAFFVRCDRTTMTQTDIDSGRLIIEIGVAPVKPAEFVIVRIGLWTASAD
jgi:uncharacterized protein